MIFGIGDRTKKRLGTTVKLHELRKGGENFLNWLSRKLSPSLMVEALDFEDGGKQFAIIAIEPTYERPVRFGHDEYIRIGENVKLLREFPEHTRSLWMATAKRKFEAALAMTHCTPETVLSALDIDRYFELKDEEKPKNSRELFRKLIYAGFVNDDMEGGYDITNLGALLFARNMEDFPSIAHKSVRVVPYHGADKSAADPEFDSKKGYALGFEELISFVQRRLPKREVYEGSIRKTVEIFPAVAVREIIANALIHQDFTIQGSGPTVEIYANRVEVWNPGNSLVLIDRIIDERNSRNQRLARSMRDLGMCEERGGGIDKAIIEIEKMSLPAPWFYVSNNNMQVVLFGPKQFNELSVLDKTWSCFCHCVIRFMRHDYMNNTTLRERFGVDDYQAVSAVIARTMKDGKIVAADPNQGRRYAKYVPYWGR